MELPKKVKLVEVGPRDGLQNEPNLISTDIKIELINRLSQTGLPTIEVSSFVSPKWVPQLSDAKKVYQGIQKTPGVHYPVLVPNRQGLENALEAGVSDIAILTAASETFSQKNTNCSIAESLDRIETIIQLTKEKNISVRGYISCVLGCPYEGKVSIARAQELTKTLIQMGCYEVSLGDTVGVGTPNKVKALVELIQKDISPDQLAVHFHDTYGQALANIYAALKSGITTIDCSIAGLGGCPYAPGASGNVATEDVLYLLSGLGIETGVNMDALIAADHYISATLKRPTRSKVAQALARGLERDLL